MIIITTTTTSIRINQKKSNSEEPSFESSIIRIPFEKGKTINFDKSRMITKQSVMLTAKKKITQFYCSGKSKLEINPGDKIEYLQYRAEGYAACRVKGEICEVFIMGNEPAFDGLDKKPIVEWWVRVINHHKKPVGWLVLDYNEFNQIEFGERKF